MTSRRAFFAQLAGAAAIALDPERGLWVPGRKLISIPRPRPMIAFERDAYAIVWPPIQLLPPSRVITFEWTAEDIERLLKVEG